MLFPRKRPLFATPERGSRPRRAARRRGLPVPALALLLAMCSAAAAADRPDAPEDRIAAAETYLRLVPVERMTDNVVRNLLLRIPEEKRGLFRQGIAEGLVRANFEDIMVKIVAKHFNAAEIDAMTAFYGSPEGRSIEKKLPGYMADISLHVIPIIQKSVSEVMAKHIE